MVLIRATRTTYIVPPALVHIRGFGVARPDLEGRHICVDSFGDIQALVPVCTDGPAVCSESPLLGGGSGTGAQEGSRSILIFRSKTHRRIKRGLDEKLPVEPSVAVFVSSRLTEEVDDVRRCSFRECLSCHCRAGQQDHSCKT